MEADGTGTPEGRWERRRVPMPREGKGGGPLGGQRIRRKCGQHFTCPLGLCGACCDPRPDAWPTEAPSIRVGPERVGERERGTKVKVRLTGPTHLRGSWGRERVPTPGGAHPWLRDQQGQRRPLREQRNGREHSESFPCPLGYQGYFWAPGPNLPPVEAPSGHTEPKPQP